MIHAARLALGLILLAGCAAPPPPSRQARADQNAAAACRHRSDQIYAQQNRKELFIGEDLKDTPFASNYVSGNTARGLGDEHARDDQFADCVRETEQNHAAGPPAAAAIAAP